MFHQILIREKDKDSQWFDESGDFEMMSMTFGAYVYRAFKGSNNCQIFFNTVPICFGEVPYQEAICRQYGSW